MKAFFSPMRTNSFRPVMRPREASQACFSLKCFDCFSYFALNLTICYFSFKPMQKEKRHLRLTITPRVSRRFRWKGSADYRKKFSYVLRFFKLFFTVKFEE